MAWRENRLFYCSPPLPPAVQPSCPSKQRVDLVFPTAESLAMLIDFLLGLINVLDTGTYCFNCFYYRNVLRLMFLMEKHHGLLSPDRASRKIDGAS